MSSYRLHALILVLSVTACGPRESGEPVNAVMPPVYFMCGETELKAVAHDGTKMLLDIDNNSYDLDSVPSASGTKYETPGSAMPHLIFWNKGREADLTVDDKIYPHCHQIDEQHPTDSDLPSG